MELFVGEGSPCWEKVLREAEPGICLTPSERPFLPLPLISVV